MSRFDSIADSSIYQKVGHLSGVNPLDGLIRVGIVKTAVNDEDTNELRYVVEVRNKNDRVPMNCRMMRKFGGAFNYEDFVMHGYTADNNTDIEAASSAKAGDVVIVGQLAGRDFDGVILGSLMHTARTPTLDVTDGPQYKSEFNGIEVSINSNGEYTVTFKGQPTNLSVLDDAPSQDIPVPEYDEKVGTSFFMFDKTGSFTVNDNAEQDPQLLKIDKPNGTFEIQSGEISLKLTKKSKLVELACTEFDISADDALKVETKTYTVDGSEKISLKSPQVAIGTDGIELLDQLAQLIDALGNLTPISPVGPCTTLNTTPTWVQVALIKAKIQQITGSL